MLQDPRALFSLFGFMIWGDFGPFTMYRSQRGKIVAFAKTWPQKPASDKQAALRQRFKDASKAWTELSDDTQTEWHLAADRLSLCCHGYNLWMHWKMQLDDTYIRTIQRQSHTNLIS